MPTERIELSPPGLRDQCSASELRRLIVGKILFKQINFFLNLTRLRQHIKNYKS